MFAKNPQNSEKNNVAKGTFDLWDLYKIDTITHDLKWESYKDQFPGESKKVFEKAKNIWIKLEYDNSRSNWISIQDKNGVSIWHVRVFMNANWKQQLVGTMEKLVK